MQIVSLAKNRVILRHHGQTLRIEVSDAKQIGDKDEWNIYYPLDATIHTTGKKIVHRRKVTIKAPRMS